MKKLYSLICASALTLTAFATNHYVAVGLNAGGTPANVYTPAATTAAVGDSVTFIQGSVTPHTVTSTSVPGGAAAMSSGTMSTPGQTYVYVITVAGMYSFDCAIHGAGMSGTINASAAGVIDPTVDLATSAYPNPFKDKITVKYGSQITKLKIFNVIGEEVKSMELPAAPAKVEVDFEGIPSGIYFMRTYNDATIVETKKIIRTK